MKENKEVCKIYGKGHVITSLHFCDKKESVVIQCNCGKSEIMATWWNSEPKDWQSGNFNLLKFSALMLNQYTMEIVET